MIKYFFVFFLAQIGYQAIAQQLVFKLSNVHENLSSVKVYLTDLAGYETLEDSCKITQQKFVYDKPFLEPQKIKVKLFWANKKVTNLSFMASLPGYIINIKEDLKPILEINDKSNFDKVIAEINLKLNENRRIKDSLTTNISYKNQSVNQVESRIEFLRDSMDKLIDPQIYNKFYTQNLDNAIGLYALCQYAERPHINQRVKSSPNEIENLFNKLSSEVKKLPSAKKLLNKIRIAKQLSIGMMFSDIALADTNGHSIKILELNKTYLLIDFWASWCVPCRAENPVLIKSYRKYRAKGLNIVSITIDETYLKEKWLQAIHQDGVNLWTHLSDFDHIAQKQYGITFIPTNYLINAKGEILARDLRGDNLEKKLNELFGK